MSWFYAGPDGQPVGPLTQEELFAKRAQGELKPETYILEQGGIGAPTWRRYQEVFPISTLPVVPSGELPPAYPAAPLPAQYPPLVRTNTWAVIGAVVGVMSLALIPVCCIGFFLSLPGLFFSALGYYEIERNKPHESGKGVAITGLITSGISLLLVIVFTIWSFYINKGFTTSFQNFQHLQSPPSFH